MNHLAPAAIPIFRQSITEPASDHPDCEWLIGRLLRTKVTACRFAWITNGTSLKHSYA